MVRVLCVVCVCVVLKIERITQVGGVWLAWTLFCYCSLRVLLLLFVCEKKKE